MTVGELKKVLGQYDDDATILEVHASLPDGAKWYMTASHANRPMDVSVKVGKPIEKPSRAEMVLMKAREAAKAATGYEGLFREILRLTVEAYPTPEARLEFQKTPQFIALRAILRNAMDRFNFLEAS